MADVSIVSKAGSGYVGEALFLSPSGGVTSGGDTNAWAQSPDTGMQVLNDVFSHY